MTEQSVSERVFEKFGLNSRLNTSDEEILENVRTNIRRQLPQVHAQTVRDERICIVGGGWSLEETFDELRDLYFRGAKLVACNGAGKWLLERNLKPSALVVLDARESCKRFVDIDCPGLKYFLASQCNPAVFDAAKGETYIWHAGSVKEEDEIVGKYYCGNTGAIGGTSCVGFRALAVMRVLGYQWFDIFGVDSCYSVDGRHHAYPQEENNDESTTVVTCAGREFRVSGWQIAQATYFREFIQRDGNKFHINVHGDGLIAHMIKTAAELSNGG